MIKQYIHELSSSVGVNLVVWLKELEGFVPTPYVPKGEALRPGRYTIGYGHTFEYLGARIHSADDIVWTREKAHDVLLSDIASFLLLLRTNVEYFDELPADIRFSCISLAYNVGIGPFVGPRGLGRGGVISSVRKALDVVRVDRLAGTPLLIEAFTKYIYSGKNKLLGLARRRVLECLVFDGTSRYSSDFLYKALRCRPLQLFGPEYVGRSLYGIRYLEIFKASRN